MSAVGAARRRCFALRQRTQHHRLQLVISETREFGDKSSSSMMTITHLRLKITLYENHCDDARIAVNHNRSPGPPRSRPLRDWSPNRRSNGRTICGSNASPSLPFAALKCSLSNGRSSIGISPRCSKTESQRPKRSVIPNVSRSSGMIEDARIRHQPRQTITS